MATTATGCTSEEIARWVQWHTEDPAAAEAFANLPAVQEALAAGEADNDDGPSEPHTSWTVNWDAVAQCESGGNWNHGVVSNRYGRFGGGLMIGLQWWAHWGGGEFASTPGGATKAQQIIVAERIVDANGGGYAGADRGWQCVR